MKRTIIILIVIIMAFGNLLWSQLPLTDEFKSPFVNMVKNIRESVVNIRVEYEVELSQRGGLPFNDEFFRFFFPDLPREENQPRTRTSLAMGSGFIFNRQGSEIYIITNNHVAENGSKGEITVTLADKAQYKAEIVGLDADTDLAIIKVTVANDEDITIAPLGDSDEIEIGDWAIAIGNPFGQLGLERTVTVGVISATGRANLQFGDNSPLYQDFIQTDAAINPGNSGGPLLNIRGEVIGVNSAITSTSGGNLGIGFAIPINIARKVSEDLINKGRVVRAYIGILPQDIDYDLRKSLKLKQVAGVLVAQVEKDTPAEAAGLEKGDVIIRFNDIEIPNVAKFRLAVANSRIGEEIPLTIIRNGKDKILKVKLVERPLTAEVEQEIKAPVSVDLLGMQVAGLDSDFARQREIDEKEGVIITSVTSDSPAARSGLRPGDIILEINQSVVKDVKDFERIINNLEEDIVLFYVKTTRGNYQFTTINLG